MDNGSAAGRHSALLLDQLTEERTRKGSLEQRGIAVISTAGTLVAIVLGFVSLATRTPVAALPPTVVVLLGLALAILVAASATGVAMNVPARVPVVDAADLAEIAQGADWDHLDPADGRVEYRLQTQMLIALRDLNRVRARLLTLALVLEVLALALMSVGAVLILWPLSH